MISAEKMLQLITSHTTLWKEMGQFVDKDMARHYAASIYSDNTGVTVKNEGGVYVVTSWKRIR